MTNTFFDFLWKWAILAPVFVVLALNSVVKNIFNSKLCSDYAFIERLNEHILKKLANNKIHNIDINKCRKNILYYGQFNYPVFSVMDSPVNYNNKTGSGLYYVESDN